MKSVYEVINRYFLLIVHKYDSNVKEVQVKYVHDRYVHLILEFIFMMEYNVNRTIHTR